jgi:UDP-2-acetamido-3-amino-2,3-dideoxy-glucuronate N-acetyltransferase
LIAPTADVDERARIAESARVWHLAQIREGAVIGENCIVGRGAYIDTGVRVGDNCKIQNHALLYTPAELEEGVFVGPAVVFTNDMFPRAINPDGTPKTGSDWRAVGVKVRRGAAIGARAVVLGGVEVGEWALVAAGSVVTEDVVSHALVAGVPARRIGWVGLSGVPLQERDGLWVEPGTDERFTEVDGRLVAE